MISNSFKRRKRSPSFPDVRSHSIVILVYVRNTLFRFLVLFVFYCMRLFRCRSGRTRPPATYNLSSYIRYKMHPDIETSSVGSDVEQDSDGRVSPDSDQSDNEEADFGFTHVNSDKESETRELKLCGLLQEYDRYLQLKGKRSLSAWLRSKNIVLENIDLPTTLMYCGNNSRSPIQHILSFGNAACRDRIIAVNDILSRLRLSTRESSGSSSGSSTTIAKTSIANTDIIFETSVQTTEKSIVAMPLDLHLYEKIFDPPPAPELDLKVGKESEEKQDYKGDMETLVLWDLSKSNIVPDKEIDPVVKTENESKSESESDFDSLHLSIEARSRQHWILWPQNPTWIPENPENLTSDQMVEIYEICHFLGYSTGVLWVPSSSGLIEIESDVKSRKSRGKESMAVYTHTKRANGQMHPSVLGIQLLSSPLETRMNVADLCIRAGGAAFVSGLRDYMEHGSHNREIDIDKKIMAEYFGYHDDSDLNVKSISDANSKSKSKYPVQTTNRTIQENIAILGNHAMISLREYREKVPVFAGWLASLPTREIGDGIYREKNMTAEDIQSIMQIGLFFCWLPIAVHSIRSIGELDYQDFQHVIIQANRREATEHLTGIDKLLLVAMKLSNISDNEPIPADALDYAMRNSNETVRASYYVFSQKVCHVISRFAIRHHIQETVRTYKAKGKEYEERFDEIRKRSGDQWRSIITRVRGKESSVS